MFCIVQLKNPTSIPKKVLGHMEGSLYNLPSKFNKGCHLDLNMLKCFFYYFQERETMPKSIEGIFQNGSQFRLNLELEFIEKKGSKDQFNL
jgi:hypothetical protein